MTAIAAGESVVVLSTFADAKDAYRSRDLRQSLYDEGEVVMADVLVNLHGDEHRARRRVENRMFRREVFERYERDLFPEVTERTLAPHLARGRADLVHLGHELMLNLAALTAGVDRPAGTAEETRRLHEYMMLFIEGATLAHSTRDAAGKAERRLVIAAALQRWAAEFLTPSIAHRRDLLARERAGEEVEVPRDVLATLLRHSAELGLAPEVVRREVAFFLLAGAHTSATAFVRSIDHVLGWVERHPEDAGRAAGDALFVQRCVHETVRLNPSSPVGRRRALAPVRLRSGTEIPQGATVVIDLQAVNRDPTLFGPDAADFDPRRTVPPGVAPFGLSFAAGMHVCIGQDLAAGVVPRAATGSPGPAPAGPPGRDDHLYGLVTGAVQRMFAAGVRRDPAHPPQRDASTARPYWGTYPVLLGTP
jgi:cytochrome P450